MVEHRRAMENTRPHRPLGGFRALTVPWTKITWSPFGGPLNELYAKGKIYEGEKVLLYCVRDATPISKAEVAMDSSTKKTPIHLSTSNWSQKIRLVPICWLGPPRLGHCCQHLPLPSTKTWITWKCRWAQTNLSWPKPRSRTAG